MVPHLNLSYLSAATEKRIVVRSRARAPEAAGEGRNIRGTILDDRLGPQNARRCLLLLARAAPLSSSSRRLRLALQLLARLLRKEQC
jgi:hypothetical protein